MTKKESIKQKFNESLEKCNRVILDYELLIPRAKQIIEKYEREITNTYVIISDKPYVSVSLKTLPADFYCSCEQVDISAQPRDSAWSDEGHWILLYLHPKFAK